MSMMKCTKRSVFWGISSGLVFGTALIMSSCASGGEIGVNVGGVEKMNEGYPALVCIYQLNNAMNFEHVSLESFWRDGAKAFAADVVGPRKDFMLNPGTNQWVKLQILKETSYIGVAVDFRQPDPKRWRLVYDISVKRPKKILFTVYSDRIEIAQK